jgi:hypothetical protein
MSSRPLGSLGKQILHSPSRMPPTHAYESHMGSKHINTDSVKTGKHSQRLKLFFVVIILCCTYTVMSLLDPEISEVLHNKKNTGRNTIRDYQYQYIENYCHIYLIYMYLK